VYDTGVYPETIAVLARGSLEKLIEAIGEKIAAWRSNQVQNQKETT
jgi:hypothetical protein